MADTPAPPGSVPSSTELRQKIADLVIADSVGPAGGERKTLTDPRERVSVRYLVGMLAPRGTWASDPARQDNAAVDGDNAVADPAEDDGTTAKPALVPASFGMTFAVRRDVADVRVIATWGKYVKEEQVGHEQRVWQRYRRRRIWTQAHVAHSRVACQFSSTPIDPDACGAALLMTRNRLPSALTSKNGAANEGNVV
jgi:hypothetical protein